MDWKRSHIRGTNNYQQKMNRNLNNLSHEAIHLIEYRVYQLDTSWRDTAQQQLCSFSPIYVNIYIYNITYAKTAFRLKCRICKVMVEI